MTALVLNLKPGYVIFFCTIPIKIQGIVASAMMISLNKMCELAIITPPMSIFTKIDQGYPDFLRRYISVVLDLFFLLASLKLLEIGLGWTAEHVLDMPSPESLFNLRLGRRISNVEQLKIDRVLWVHFGAGILNLLTALLVFPLMWIRFGYTPGQYVLGLRIVNQDFTKISVKQAIIRALFSTVSFAICGLGFIWPIFDRRGRTWHDMVSRTMLVYKNLANFV